MSFVNVAETNQPPLVASNSISTKEDATRQQKANAKAFTQYEREHSATLVKVRRIIARNGSPSSDSSLYDAESLLSEADALTTAMRGLADSSKSPFNTIWKKKEERCKAEVGPLKEEITRGVRKMQEVSRKRKEEESNAEYAMSSSDDPFGAKLMETAGLLNEQESLLLESQRLCAESEEFGASTLGTMGIQREQIQGASTRLHETISMTEQARLIIRSMIRKAIVNKIVLYFVIGLLIVLNGLALKHIFSK